ncbi:MAG: TetR/AcrR family transcriptional regulator [Gemmataceae bacterium]|nr:TetR/AcrR family transcriptional regulator [Gemmataceae bacterium]MCI0743710.1 TetR/AcrR family transcriptional regulator [Gemmataceae bacterium]
MPVVSKERRGRPKRPVEQLQERREAILDAAAPVFARHGYPGTEIQAVADACNVGKGTIYLYFASKEDLFLAAVDRGMLRLCAAIETGIAGISDALDQLAAAIRTYLQFFRDYPEYVELLIQERAEFRDRKQPTYFEHRERNAERWRDLYRGLIAAGRVRDVPVERIMDVLGNLVYGTMFTNHFLKKQKPPAAQAAEIIDIAFHGILTPAERRRRD